MNGKIVTIVGGTGFLGRYVVRRLAKAGYTLRVISRDASQASHLKTAGTPGQIVLINGDITKVKTLDGKLAGSYAVVNLVGILFESGRQKFATVQTQGAEKLAQMSKLAGAKRFIQVSALGVNAAGKSRYARTKLQGEKAVLTTFADATILRPSVIFGPEDNFINQFACMAAVAPALPLIGGGNTRFQPVYVDDVANAIEQCLAQPETKGQTYELGGPQTYSFREILHYILRATGRDRALVPLPFSLASLVGAVSEILPHPPLTRDQVRLLRHDNVVNPNAKGFAQLDIAPSSMEAIVPEYLVRFRKGHKAAA